MSKKYLDYEGLQQYDGKIKEYIEEAANDAYYLGDMSIYTTSNRLDISKLDVGTYVFGMKDTSSYKAYITGTKDDKTFTGSLSVSLINGANAPTAVYLIIETKVSDLTLTTSDTVFGHLAAQGYASGGQVQYYTGDLKLKRNNDNTQVTFTSSSVGSNFVFTTTNTNQTISGIKTFSALPESSVTPTTNNQLVNKKYVDDNAGGGENYFVNIQPNFFSSLTMANIQNIIDNMLQNNITQVYLIGNNSGYRNFNAAFATLSSSLSTSITSYVLTAYKMDFPSDIKNIQLARQAYNVTISWNNDVPTVTAKSNSGSMETNYIYCNGNTTDWTPSTNYSPASKKYVDDSAATKQNIIQYSTLPTAASTNLGQIAQYTGTTDANYTNGYFYQVVSDGQATPTYSWENINVQSGGSSGGEIHYLGNVSSYREATPLDVTNLEPGVYILYNDYNSDAMVNDENLYITGTNNEKTGTCTISIPHNDTYDPYVLYLEVYKKFSDISLTTSSVSFLYIHYGGNLFSGNTLKYKQITVKVNKQIFTNKVIISTSGDTPVTRTFLSSSAVAPSFSTSSTYAVGDYVVMGENLYECTTAVTVAGTWNSANWTQVTVTGILGNLASTLNNLNSGGGAS